MLEILEKDLASEERYRYRTPDSADIEIQMWQ